MWVHPSLEMMPCEVADNWADRGPSQCAAELRNPDLIGICGAGDRRAIVIPVPPKALGKLRRDRVAVRRSVLCPREEQRAAFVAEYQVVAEAHFGEIADAYRLECQL